MLSGAGIVGRSGWVGMNMAPGTVMIRIFRRQLSYAIRLTLLAIPFAAANGASLNVSLAEGNAEISWASSNYYLSLETTVDLTSSPWTSLATASKVVAPWAGLYSSGGSAVVTTNIAEDI